jgi:anti-sigma regulatory factor (Ser/Thr protein kinase)
MCVRIEREVPSGPLAPQQIRDFIGAQLNAILGSSPRADVTDDARLVASELATNAIRAGSTSVGLVVVLHRETVEIEIYDDAVGQPIMRSAEPTADTGRGLLIVDDLAVEWGAEPPVGGRKAVWATLPVPPHLTHALCCEHLIGSS